VNNKIFIIGAFILAFIFVTGAIIYLNTIYTNIFKYDFTPVGQMVADTSQQATQQNQLQEQKVDSTTNMSAAVDSLNKNIQQAVLDTASMVTLKDTNSIAKVKNIVADQKKINNTQLAKTDNEKSENVPITKSIAKSDTTYRKWIKTTGKLYESMDSKKAAKIILGYSDNIARDMLLSMRKKKAAEIVAEFKPEIAARIMSLN
jgi:flagellar motility protein MotE (MotC chaperone)